jgi:hypothetical protein
MPTQAITRPAFCTPAAISPQLAAPVMMKLSAPPRSARPTSRMVTEVGGEATKRSERRYMSPDAAAANRPATTARLAPRLSA